MSLRILTRLAISSASPARRQPLRVESAEIFASTLERLGATFVKFGQILAMRPDFLPLEYITALGRLLDSVPPFSTAEARSILENEWQSSIESICQTFSDRPIASASFGQVYRAELRSGDIVAIKVLRPGIEMIVKTDMRFISAVARLLDIIAVSSTKVTDLYKEFRTYTVRELDYRIEARNVGKLAVGAASIEEEHIPDVYWDLCTRRVLVLEFLEGIWLSEILAALNQGNHTKLRQWELQGMSLPVVAINLLRSLLKQGFETGVFHADPHAGNLVVMHGNTVGFADFGIIGVIGGGFRDNLLELLHQMGDGSSTGAFAAIIRLLEPGPDVDLRRFKHDYEMNMQEWIQASQDPHATMREKSVARLLFNNLAIVRRYGLSLPPVVLRFYRALIIMDSIILQIDPTINLSQGVREFLRTLTIKRLLGQLSSENYYITILASQAALVNLPFTLSRIAEDRNMADSVAAARSLGPQHAYIALTFRRFLASSARIISNLAFIVAAVTLFAGIVARSSTIKLPAIGPMRPVVLVAILIGLGMVSRYLSRVIRSRAN